MYSEPCAKFSTPSTPKISVSPAAMRKSSIACVRPFRAWTARKAGSPKVARSTTLLGAAQRLQLLGRSHRLLARDVLDVAHDEERVLGRLLQSAPPLALVGLVIRRAHGDGPHRRVDGEALQRVDDLL